MIDDRFVEGYCPMGCGKTLFAALGGFITCSHIACPRPDAVADLLGDPETEHIVQFNLVSFDIRHPLRERLDGLDGLLFRCKLFEDIAMMAGPPARPGKYRATRDEKQKRWHWEWLGE